MSTPLHAQYTRINGQCPQAIMFFRLGDFYEMFDEDARIGAHALDLTLTTREFARSDRAPMCGVPYHAVETHLARLVARGYTVAICEQIGDPRACRGLVQREVVRVVTPSATLARGHCSAPDRPHSDDRVKPVFSGEGVAVAHVSGTPPAATAGRTEQCPTTVDMRVEAFPVEVRKPAATSLVQLTLFDGIDEPSAP